MIQISIGNDAITIDGHSEDAPHGQSVPCEAVTVLVNTYIASLADYKEPKYELWRLNISRERYSPGHLRQGLRW